MKELKISTGIIRNAAGEVFITQRAADGHMANKWEFPGGKIEEGESPEMALAVELFEEVGILPESAFLLISLNISSRTGTSLCGSGW